MTILSAAPSWPRPPSCFTPRAAAGRQALALPDLPAHLHAHHLAGLFHNLLVGGRTEEARAIKGAHANVATGAGREPAAAHRLNEAARATNPW